MQSLAEALQAVRRKSGLNQRWEPYVPNHLDPLDPGSRNVEDELLNLRPTHEIRAEIEAVRDEMDVLDDAEESQARTLSKLRHMVGILEVELSHGERRDTLAEGRPVGCWCLGLGGRDYTGTLAKLDPPADAVWRVTCPACDEGKESERRRLKAVAYYETELKIDRHALRLAEADVPARYQRCTLENFPVTPDTEASLAKVRAWNEALADGKPAKHSVFLHGPLGSGKTSLACALLGLWRERTGAIGQFATATRLMEAIRSAREDHKSRAGILTAVIEHPFVVLDDLGAEMDTRWVSEQLMSIINGRHNENKITIITSNFTVSQIAAKIAQDSTDEMLAMRIGWRLTEMCEVIEVNGPNFRDPEVAAALGLSPASDSTNSNV